MRETINAVNHQQASKLLHNKFVVVLGDSIQRSVYKDIVLLLQKDKYLSLVQLKSKGEMSFEQDVLVEGGRMGQMTNGTEYHEVRQFQSDHHLVRFYFLTRIFSRYMQSILDDFERGLKPDVVIINSCVWDVSRYNSKWHVEYKENLHKFFEKIKLVLHPECIVMWSMTMPLGKRIVGGFLVPEVEERGPTLRYDVIEANFYSCQIADAYGLDVLDLHFKFRFSLQHRMKDGVHWNAVAHRHITSLLLQHIAQAWGVALHCPVTTVETISHSEQPQLQACSNNMVENMARHSWRFPSVPRYRIPDLRTINTDRFRGCWRTDSFSPYHRYWPQAEHFSHSATDWQPANSGVQRYRPREGLYNGYKQHFYEDTLPDSPKFGIGYLNFKDNQAKWHDLRNGPRAAPAHHRLMDHRFIENGEQMQAVLHNEAYRPRPYVDPPACPESRYVMRKKPSKKHYAPYTRQRPHDYCR
ncbi:PC-esterase domain-containing protein 1A isoform X1 [Esox lucius]|uniref:Family with sequence similarity 113 n=1 Tax=Esox lucius TaxID=8010 RepID=A0A3P8XW56_ESOLU|nr:PC-esterase domain-containing protein 1A isoform X1 [Esox lucius]